MRSDIQIKAKKGDKSLAAIGCAQAAELYGLSVLEKNINESRANTTRFGIFSGTENTSAGRLESDGFALVFTVKNEAGALLVVFLADLRFVIRLLVCGNHALGDEFV